MMILSVCLNPVIQKTLSFKDFHLDKVNRTDRYRLDPGGKGVNVARVLKQLGAEVTTLTHIGGNNSREFLDLLKRDGLKVRYSKSKTIIRSCYTLLGLYKASTTEIVEEAKSVDPKCEKDLIKIYKKLLPKFDYIVISGSKAPGYSKKLIPELISLAKDLGKKVIVDIKGEDLNNALIHEPDIIKHNLNEFYDTFGKNSNFENVARKLNKKNISIVVTDGEKPIYFYEDNKKITLDIKASDRAINTTGCGDAFTAGLTFALSKGLELRDAIKSGIKCGRLNAQSIIPGNIKD